MSLIYFKEEPLNIKVLLQSPLKTNGDLPTPSMGFILKHALLSQFNQTGYKAAHTAVLCLDEMLWLGFNFTFLCLHSWIVSYTSAVRSSISVLLHRDGTNSTNRQILLFQHASHESLSSSFTKKIACMSPFVLVYLHICHWKGHELIRSIFEKKTETQKELPACQDL